MSSCVTVCVCVCLCVSGPMLVPMWFELSGSLAALVGMRVFLFKHREMSGAPTLVPFGGNILQIYSKQYRHR